MSGRGEVHQGNEMPGFYYGPRCIMGGQKENLLETRLEKKTIEIHSLYRIFIMEQFSLVLIKNNTFLYYVSCEYSAYLPH